MSVRASSDPRREGTPRENLGQFTRWPGLLSLSLGVLLGPTIALVVQSIIYAANMWACGRNLRGTLHIIPFLGLIVVIGAAVGSYVNWRAVGKGVEDEHQPIASRVRFLAWMGMLISIFSALVIIAQWGAIFVFQPCQRA